MAPSKSPSNWTGYETLTEEAPKSIVWASTGGDGSGKSHFGLTAPGPIFVCAFDPYGMNRVSADVKRGKEIRIARYAFDSKAKEFENSSGEIDRGKRMRAAEALWAKFRDDFDNSLKNARTVLIDREDLYYEVQRYANFGDQSDAPKEYGPLYTETTWLIQKAQGAEINLGVLRGLREKWVSKFDPAKGKMVAHNTGELIPDGMKKIPDLVDITLAHRWDATLKAFVVKIDKFTNANEKGNEYPDLTFPDMAGLAYPDSDMASWQ